MINLLPPDTKQNYSFARLNVILRRWVVALFVVLIGVGAMATYGYLEIKSSKDSYQKQINSTQAQLQTENLKRTTAQIQSISSSLKLSVKVLGNEVLFSKLLNQIGAAMPSGAILTGIQLTGVTGGIDLSVNSTTFNSATQVQVNLTASNNPVFSKVDIESLKCTSPNSAESSGSSSEYPCTATYRALFNSKNQFLFINQVTN